MARTAALALCFACGPTLPPRYVIERDVGDLQYRRYQHVLDVEFRIEGNDAEGHTATYLRRTGGDNVILATAFVSVYEHAASLTAEVSERLEDLGTYEVSVERLEGDYVWRLQGDDVPWVLWVSGKHLVKLSGPSGGDIPEELAESYIDAYPSDLDERGRAREGTDSAGSSQRQVADEAPLDVPTSLREDSPR